MVFPAATVIEAKLLQFPTILEPMLVTELGISILVNPEQLEKALPPIVVTAFGMVMDVNPQPLNALFPIVMREFGRVTTFNDDFPLNKLLASVIVPFKISI